MKIGDKQITAIQIYKKIYNDTETQGAIIAKIDDIGLVVNEEFAAAIQYEDRVEVINDDRGSK